MFIQARPHSFMTWKKLAFSKLDQISLSVFVGGSANKIIAGVAVTIWRSHGV